MCMLHVSTPNSFIIRSFFKNNSCSATNNYNGLLYSLKSKDISVSECIFLENNVSVIYFVLEGVIYVKNCICDNFKFTLSKDGSVNIDEMNTNFLRLEISFLSLGSCEVNNPFKFDISLTRIMPITIKYPFNRPFKLRR